MTAEDHTIQTQNQALARQGTGYQDSNVVHTEAVTVFAGTPEKAMAEMTSIAKTVALQINNTNFITKIQGKNYPKVEWWTTIGAALGLFPVVKYSRRLDRDDEVIYESRVEVMNNGRIVTAGEAICSSKERNWGNRDEYAIKSMAITRATGKAYRTGLSMIAVMAGLEATPAEEMEGVYAREQTPQPPQQRQAPRPAPHQSQAPPTDAKPWLNITPRGSSEHTDDWKEVARMVTSGLWSRQDVFDRFKVSKAVNAELAKLEQMPKQEVQEAQVEEDGDGLPF
jgi:hypothetical protein